MRAELRARLGPLYLPLHLPLHLPYISPISRLSVLLPIEPRERRGNKHEQQQARRARAVAERECGAAARHGLLQLA